MQEIPAGINECALRHQPHNLSTGDTYSTCGCRTAHLIKCHMQRCDIDIRDIHRDLRYTVLINEPPDGFGALECSWEHYHIAIGILHRFTVGLAALALGSALLTHIKRYGIGTAGRCSIEIEINRYEEIARTHSRGSGTGDLVVKRAVAEISAIRSTPQPFGQSFIFTLAAYGKILSLRGKCSRFITIYRDFKFVSYALAEFARKLRTLLERDAGNRNEG